MRNVRVLDVELGPLLATLVQRSGTLLSGRAQARHAATMRNALESILKQVVEDVKKDYYRSGHAYRTMRYGGIRVFGTSLATIRGHIMAPGYIKVLEEGGTITPTEAPQLAIPIADGLRPDGTPKLPRPAMWKNIKNTFTFKSPKTGRGYIVYKEGDKMKFLYVFVDEVEITGRFAIEKAWLGKTGQLIGTMTGIVTGAMAGVNVNQLAGVKPGSAAPRGRKK